MPRKIASETNGKKTEVVKVPPPDIREAIFTIEGDVPLVMHKFSKKARQQMMEKMSQGSRGNKQRGKKEARDFDADYEGAIHYDKQGFAGIPCGAIRAALVSACRLVNFKMTIAKLSLFIHADGFDRDDGTPLVRITKGKPHRVEHAVRLETGVADVRVRPMWDPGWQARVRVRYDADQFSMSDAANLLVRAGIQVGLLEGRPDSKKSCGMGWGTFTVATK